MPTAKASFYDLDNYKVIFGPVLFDGFAEGDAFSIEFQERRLFYTGADGKHTSAKSYNDRATVTIRLAESSAANALLSTIFNGDMVAPNGAGALPFLIANTMSGLTVIQAAQAVIVGPPAFARGNQIAELEWQIECLGANVFLGNV